MVLDLPGHLPADHWRQSGTNELLFEEGDRVLLKFTIRKGQPNEVSSYNAYRLHWTGDLGESLFRTRDENEALEKWLKVIS